MAFRPKFALRSANRAYWRKLSQVLRNPFSFYFALLVKILPGLPSPTLRLRLKDGKQLKVEEFWTLFLFDEIFMQSCYEPSSLLSRRIESIIDVGANRGLFTLRAKQLWPSAKVVCIEPEPTNFGQLKENIAINDLTDVTSLQIGLAEKCGCFDLYLSPRNIAGHSLYNKTGAAVQIETRTLNDILAMMPNGRCDLIKIDCEGCEFAILNSLTAEMADRIGYIIFEPERSLFDVGALNEKLSGLGFEIAEFGNTIVAIH